MNERRSENQAKLDQICINTIRTLSMDAVQKANSGHPGAPMGLAAAAYILWTRILKHNPTNPDWLDRDRFILSGGHASMLLYSLLYLTGYGLSLDDIKNFRQWGSKTPGHPEFGHTQGVETTTGPLGQGFANGVGMAIAERHLAARFNRPGHEIVDHYTFVMCGDGDLMDGITAEAASLAGHLGLNRLICIYDDNDISIEGNTDISFTEDVATRFKAYNWRVSVIEDGNDTDAIFNAIETAKSEQEKPSLIILKTHIAFGSPNKQDTPDAHGAPLGEDEIRLTKECLQWESQEPFCVPEIALKHFRKCLDKGMASEKEWFERFRTYRETYPDMADQWAGSMSGFLPSEWDKEIPIFKPTDGPIATRAASGKILNAIAGKIPTLIGGSADLAPSNNTYLKFSHDFQKGSYNGRNIRFGVREHAMGGIMNGMFLHNGLRPYGGTFLVFADYLRPSIRLASLMRLSVIYIFTHDSIAVGEDGPTHQPIEHLASLRIIPNLTVIRPADATETADAWRQALQTSDGPVALILSRQKLPILERSKSNQENRVSRGAYILKDCEGVPDIILMASGSEVHIAMEAGSMLKEKNISARIVSMPSWELFNKQSKSYQNHILPPLVTHRIAIEAGHPMGWELYTGNRGAVIGINRFGASAPGNINMRQFGLTAENIVMKSLEILK